MKLSDLQVCGFVKVATWTYSKANLIVYDGEIVREPGIYLFTVAERILYVGSTTNNLRKRMDQYRRRQHRQKANRPVHLALGESVSSGEDVTIYVLPIANGDNCDWNGLPVNLVLGIEAALIAAIKPPWNRRGNKLIVEHEVVPSEDNDQA